MGLCRLMQHTIANRDARVAYITIPSGHQIRSSRKGIRDSSPPTVAVPILVKILKLFTHILTTEVGGAFAGTSSFDESSVSNFIYIF